MKNIEEYTLKTSKRTTKSLSGKTMKIARPQYVQRSIPSVVDGLKPLQRKILFCSFKKNFVEEAIVAGFCGYVQQHSVYHVGHESTIIGMAQDYVGSNNINLLLPNGQFGTRHHGGKDHARSRVIYTQLSPVTRFLFPKVDDILLEYLNEDGKSIEPIWYAPIIPMVLVNGSKGKGSVPNYNPLDIIANIRRLLNDEPVVAMHPWYKGFIGSIEKNTTHGSYTISGNVEEVDEKTFRITELPIRMWTQDYKEFLASVSADDHKSVNPFVEEFCDYSGGNIVHFSVRMLEERLSAVKKEGLLKKLKLTTSVSTRNMLLLDSTGVIKKYKTPEEILEEFFRVRLEIYKRRKEVVLLNLEKEILKCDNKYRFIQSVVEGSIVAKKRADMALELKAKGFTPFPKKENISEVAVAGLTNEDKGSVDNSSDYDYLLSLPIRSFFLDKRQELLAEREKHAREVEDLKQETVKSLWMRELDALEGKLIEELNKYEKTMEADRERIQRGACLYGLSKNYPQKKNQMTSKTASVEELMEVSTETEEVAEIKKTRGKAATDDDDFELEEKKKKGANEEAAAKPPPVGTKRRGSASEQSPDNKVRKLRASPFNKKGVSILGMATKSEEEESDGSDE